jgi:hypothetical protein
MMNFVAIKSYEDFIKLLQINPLKAGKPAEYSPPNSKGGRAAKG